MRSKLLITLLIILLIVVYAYFGMGYLTQNKEHGELISQIDDVSQILSQIPRVPDDLEQRLKVAQASLTAEQAASPARISSTLIIDTVLKLADESDVKATPLITQPWSVQNTTERGYTVFRLDIIVNGSYSQLKSFLRKLENRRLMTLIIEDLSINLDSLPAGGEAGDRSNLPVSATLALAIYSQPAAFE